ncbi:MAG: hypothetical protein Q9160_002569 [Pyrenula sp. 1 TL-2023]
MDLVDRKNVAKHEATLKKYAASNVDSIKSNDLLHRKEVETFKAQQAHDKERIRLRREASRQEDEDERKERELEKNDIVNKLASGKTSVDDIVRENKAKQKPGSRRKLPVSQHETETISTEPLIKGLKEVKAPEAEKAYDPFMGTQFRRDYFKLREDYPLQRLNKAKRDKRAQAGGYDFAAYYDESLVKAFAGLGCFIADEVDQHTGPGTRSSTNIKEQDNSDNISTTNTNDDVF